MLQGRCEKCKPREIQVSTSGPPCSLHILHERMWVTLVVILMTSTHQIHRFTWKFQLYSVWKASTMPWLSDQMRTDVFFHPKPARVSNASSTAMASSQHMSQSFPFHPSLKVYMFHHSPIISLIPQSVEVSTHKLRSYIAPWGVRSHTSDVYERVSNHHSKSTITEFDGCLAANFEVDELNWDIKSNKFTRYVCPHGITNDTWNRALFMLIASLHVRWPSQSKVSYGWYLLFDPELPVAACSCHASFLSILTSFQHCAYAHLSNNVWVLKYL